MPKCNVILHLGIYVNTEEKTVSMDVFRRDLYNKAIAIEMAAWHSLLFVSHRLSVFLNHILSPAFQACSSLRSDIFSGHSESFLEPPAVPVVFFIQKTASLSEQFDRLDAFYSFDFLYSVPQISIASMIGRMDSPKSDRAYSTLGGTSG